MTDGEVYASPARYLPYRILIQQYPTNRVLAIKFSPSLGVVTMCLFIERLTRERLIVKQLISTNYKGPTTRDHTFVRSYLLTNGNQSVIEAVKAHDPDGPPARQYELVKDEDLVVIPPPAPKLVGDPLTLFPLASSSYSSSSSSSFSSLPPTRPGTIPIIKSNVWARTIRTTKEEDEQFRIANAWKDRIMTTAQENDRRRVAILSDDSLNPFSKEAKIQAQQLVMGTEAYDAYHTECNRRVGLDQKVSTYRHFKSRADAEEKERQAIALLAHNQKAERKRRREEANLDHEEYSKKQKEDELRGYMHIY